MKKVVRQVVQTVEETVDVCDTCGVGWDRETSLGLLYTTVEWRYACACCDIEEEGTFRYCDLWCLRRGLSDALAGLHAVGDGHNLSKQVALRVDNLGTRVGSRVLGEMLELPEGAARQVDVT